MEDFRRITVKKQVSWVNFNRNCPNCNTYIPKYKRVCPSCGKYVKSVQGKVLIAK
jgi:rRNA maturation endonuclease Nob1